jgi:hypothetical protein
MSRKLVHTRIGLGQPDLQLQHILGEPDTVSFECRLLSAGVLSPLTLPLKLDAADKAEDRQQ